MTHAGLEATEASGATERPPLNLVIEPVAVLGAALASQPALTLEGAMAECVALEAPLTLRVLLALQMNLAEGTSRMVTAAVSE